MLRQKLVALAVLGASCAGGHAEPKAPKPIPIGTPARKAPSEPAPAPRAEDAGAEQNTTEASAPEPMCKGDATPELVRALQQRAAESRVCYERSLRHDPKLAGRLSVKFRIMSDGSTRNVAIQDSELGNEEFERCVVEIFSRALSVGPTGDCVVVTVPMRFEPKQSDAGVDAGP